MRLIALSHKRNVCERVPPLPSQTLILQKKRQKKNAKKQGNDLTVAKGVINPTGTSVVANPIGYAIKFAVLP